MAIILKTTLSNMFLKKLVFPSYKVDLRNAKHEILDKYVIKSNSLEMLSCYAYCVDLEGELYLIPDEVSSVEY